MSGQSGREVPTGKEHFVGLRGRNDVLDAFRGLLIGGVLLYHYLVRWAPPFHNADHYHYTQAYSPLWQLGQFGVHVFFIISGIVIALTLSRCTSSTEFLYRRFSRLYPAFWVAATITFVTVRILGPDDLSVTTWEFIINLTMDASDLRTRSVDGAYWSLVAEIKFYFWIAISFALLRNRFWMGIVAVAGVGAALQPFLPKIANTALIQPYIGFFLFGLATYFTVFERNRVARIWTIGAGTVAYALNRNALGVLSVPAIVPHLLVLGLGATMIILMVRGCGLSLGPLPYLGRISYSLYLLHENFGLAIISQLKTTFHQPDWVAFSAATLISAGMAALMFKYIEVPAQTFLRCRWEALDNGQTDQGISETA